MNQPPKIIKPVKDPKKEEQLKKKKRIAQAAYRDKYFSYYDDVKTSIKEDW